MERNPAAGKWKRRGSPPYRSTRPGTPRNKLRRFFLGSMDKPLKCQCQIEDEMQRNPLKKLGQRSVSTFGRRVALMGVA
jgi:hypothetical protein